jgi:hypothetical protein
MLKPLVGAGRFERPTPVRPGQIPGNPGIPSFSIPSVSNMCGDIVANCGKLWKLVALCGYNFIYRQTASADFGKARPIFTD